MIKWAVLLAVLSSSFTGQPAPSPIKFQSSTKQTSLLELYTSEGCSSCPPADSWFSGLKDAPALWKDFVPVAWHVDYWNYLGWRDPWSNGDFSERQRAYAADWHSESIYTPCLVLNGHEWHPWFRPKAGPSAPGTEVGTLTVDSSDQKHWQVQFAPVSPVNDHYQVHAVLLAGGLGSDVKAGENRGSHLTHDFVALTLVDAYLPGHTNEFHGDVVLDAGHNGGTNTQTAVAFWVTRINSLEPLQAVGGWLMAPVRQ